MALADYSDSSIPERVVPSFARTNDGSRNRLCVAIHDVAPGTWRLCEKLIAAVDQVGPVPLTFLVVPAYHHQQCRNDNACFRMLDERLKMGDELALHGYTHLDEGRLPDCPWSRLCRQVLTQGEGEFAALGKREARKRLTWGLEWFSRRGWPVSGFVPPAWLLSDASWSVLRESGLRYTTTLTRFHLLQQDRSVYAPSLVYSARSKWGSALSRHGNSACARLFGGATLVRLGLHPRDALHPQTLLHCQHLLEKLLLDRLPVTKSVFALECAFDTMPDIRPALRPALGPDSLGRAASALRSDARQ